MHVTHIECLPYGGNQGGTTEQMLRPFAGRSFFFAIYPERNLFLSDYHEKLQSRIFFY